MSLHFLCSSGQYKWSMWVLSQQQQNKNKINECLFCYSRYCHHSICLWLTFMHILYWLYICFRKINCTVHQTFQKMHLFAFLLFLYLLYVLYMLLSLRAISILKKKLFYLLFENSFKHKKNAPFNVSKLFSRSCFIAFVLSSFAFGFVIICCCQMLFKCVLNLYLNWMTNIILKVNFNKIKQKRLKSNFISYLFTGVSWYFL